MNYLMILLVALVVAVPSRAITLEEILANHIAARGGRETITKIRSMKVVGTMETMGGELSFTQYFKNNTKMRMDMSVQGMEIVQAYDGVQAWGTNPMSGGSPQLGGEAEANQAASQANIWGELIDPTDQGLTLEYVGAEDIDGMTAHLIKVTNVNKESHLVYIDAITWLEVKRTITMAMMGQEAEMEMYLSNYKDIGGVQYPMQMDMEMDGQSVMSMKRESVEVNIDIPDSLFAYPGN
ncbi:MAG: hypothetical protein ACO3I4_05065 [Candidatus Kapaibacteriota bacterium]